MGDKDDIAHFAYEKLELAETLSLSGDQTKPEEIVDLVKSTNWNLTVQGKNFVFDWVPWIRALKKCDECIVGPHNRGTSSNRSNSQMVRCCCGCDASGRRYSHHSPQLKRHGIS